MNAWIWTVVAIFVIDLVAKGIGIGFGILPRRTVGGTLVDMAVVTALLIWLAAIWK